MLDGLSDRAQQLSERSSFELLGQKPSSFVRTYHLNPDLCAFVNVSSSEGVPVTIMEALACSLPVIATDAGGTYELVKDGVNGTLLDLHPSADAIADAIIESFTLKPDSTRERAANARETWSQLSNSEQLYSSFARELKDRLQDQR